MGLFSNSKETEVTPSITVDGVQVYYTPQLQEWEFFYRDNEFHGLCLQFKMPALDQLDSLLEELESLIPQMAERLEEGWRASGEGDHRRRGDLVHQHRTIRRRRSVRGRLVRRRFLG